jgi:hypothetical protein
MSAALAFTAYLDLQSPYSTVLLAMSSGGMPDPLAGIDSYVRGATSGGNAVIFFHGFSPKSENDMAFMRRIYFRGNYSAYPRRIFTCDDSVIFSPENLSVHPFAPSAAWLKERSIRTSVTFSEWPGRDLQCTVRGI